jgi:isoquinoline 1-oxidoreductase alpha subunit
MRVNGQTMPVAADPEMPLLWVLRDLLNLTGTKYGCGIGACGACTVLVDGVPTRSCSVSVGDVGEAEITTIEGLTDATAEAVRRAWLDMNVVQCGYCQSGQIVTAVALLRAVPAPTDQEILDAMDPLLCRCGTYPRVVAALRSLREGQP